MIFYDNSGKRLKCELGERLGGEQYGNVYKISDTECIKIYKKGQIVDERILSFIRELDLKNFYKIHKLLFGRTGKFKAHTMKYYADGNIDILSMPLEYTLDNFCNLYESVIRLSENYIYACDMHTGNVILGRDGITVIDTDIYSFSELQSIEQLEKKNILALRYLFEQLFLEALDEYHTDIAVYEVRQDIRNIFETYGIASSRYFDMDKTCSKLIKYKRPIDYVKRNMD